MDDGHPLANALVFVFAIGFGLPPAQEMTDAEGRFQVGNLRRGSYIVQARAPGYVLLPDAGAEIGVPRYYRVGESVNLTMIKGGVITGTVTNAEGEAIVGATVRAIRARKLTESRIDPFQFGIAKMTDDRGIYRLYGLEPGVYVLAVGGRGAQFYGGNLNIYDGDAPTYYPSTTRDNAAELTVHAGEELNGIDVRYRGERGRAISGIVSGQLGNAGSGSINASLELFQGASSVPESFAFVGADEGNRSFAFDGIADGEYTLRASSALGNTGEFASATRKVSVRGTDVTGLELKLEPLGGLIGTVTLEPAPKANCTATRSSALPEIIIVARRDEKEKESDPTLPSFVRRPSTAPNDKGEFKFVSLFSGNYQLGVQLPGDDLYVRSLAMPAAVAPGAAKTKAQQSKAAPAPGRFTIKNGERINGVTITIAQDAATLRGRVAGANAGAALPARLRVQLVPIEPERAADPLRYMETIVESDKTFTLGHIAPGRYWVIARVDMATESETIEGRTIALDAGERDRLRSLAESAGARIELQPCQRLADYVLNYGSTPTPQTPVK